MLSSVAQALPTYTMGVFLLPVYLCEELQRMMNSYWWVPIRSMAEVLFGRDGTGYAERKTLVAWAL